MNIIICKKCGISFAKRTRNQKFCPDCSYWKNFEIGRILKQLAYMEPKLKKMADESGNPKIWTAVEYSQEFLWSLIPQSLKGE